MVREIFSCRHWTWDCPYYVQLSNAMTIPKIPELSGVNYLNVDMLPDQDQYILADQPLGNNRYLCLDEILV